MVPGYFKKAILECEEEWSQHKKLYDTRGSIRGSVPPGFAYFAVGFGLQAGYAHHVEDEATWPKDFGRDVLEGLLEHPVTAASAALAIRPASTRPAKPPVAPPCMQLACLHDAHERGWTPARQDTGIPLNRRKREDFGKVKQLITAFGQAFDPFDWTKAL